MDIPIPKIKETDFDAMSRPLELDMIAFFNIAKEDILNIIDDGNFESLNELERQINSLFE